MDNFSYFFDDWLAGHQLHTWIFASRTLSERKTMPQPSFGTLSSTAQPEFFHAPGSEVTQFFRERWIRATKNFVILQLRSSGDGFRLPVSSSQQRTCVEPNAHRWCRHQLIWLVWIGIKNDPNAMKQCKQDCRHQLQQSSISLHYINPLKYFSMFLVESRKL